MAKTVRTKAKIVKQSPITKRQKRNIEITIRVNEKELAQLKQRKQGKTMAGWLRGLALGVRPIKQADSNLIRSLGRIGSNLNQIARYVNIEKEVDQQVSDDIALIRQAMHQLLADNLNDEKDDNNVG